MEAATTILIYGFVFVLVSGSVMLFLFAPKKEQHNNPTAMDTSKADSKHELNTPYLNAENEQNLPYYDQAFSMLTEHFQDNLKQNKQIFQLTRYTITAGWMIIILGIIAMVVSILNSSEKAYFYFSLVPVIGGIITEFIAATVLAVYKSVSQQTLEYSHALERFSTIGISIGILNDMANDTITDELKPEIDAVKIKTKAEVAKLLVQLNKDIISSN